MKINGVKNLTFALSISLVLSGCSLQKSSYPTDVTEIVETKIEDTNNNRIDEEIEVFKNLELEDNIITTADRQMFMAFNLASSSHKEECKADISTDTYYVIERIKENSKADNSIFDTYYGDRVERILKEKLNSIDINEKGALEDYHLYNDMKIIVGDNGLNLIRICIPNTIIIDIEQLYNLEMNNNDDYLTPNLNYFLNVVRQYNCECNCQNVEENNRGLVYGNYTSTILDITAASDELDSSCLQSVIRYALEYGRELYLLSLFSDLSIEDFNQAVYTNDYNKLYDFFDLKNEAERHNFYNILEAVDSKCGFANMRVQIDNYIIDGLTTDEYKSELFRTYLIKLLEYNKKNKLSLEDNLFFLTLGKYVITDDSYISDNISLSTQLLAMENEYKQFLKEYYYTSDSKIKNKELEIHYIISNANDLLYNNGRNIHYANYLDRTYDYLNRFPKLKLVLDYGLLTGLDYDVMNNNLEKHYKELKKIYD